jgi:hypothetical protein
MLLAYRPHSPAVGSSPVLGKSTCTGQSLLRPYSWPANKSPKPEDGENTKNHTLSEPHKSTHFHSLAEDVKQEGNINTCFDIMHVNSHVRLLYMCLHM